MSGIFPSNYLPATGGNDGGERPNGRDRYFEPNKLADGESTTLRLCGTHASGHVIAGFQYFTEAGQIRRFPTYPKNYLDDIGLTWDGKNNGTGEKDKPKYFLSWVVMRKDAEGYQVMTITQKGIRESIEEVLTQEEDYFFLDSGLANFHLKITRKGTKLDTSYVVIPTMKAPTKKEEADWQEAGPSIWLPAMFENGDPFAGKASEGCPVGLPPSARDSLGADRELATAGW